MPDFEFSFSNQHPFLLTPVQVQVKFIRRDKLFLENHPGRTPLELLVRIFPDVFNVTHHEDALTDSERLAGEAYWRQAGSAPDRALGQLHSLLAWSNLVEKYGAPRAHWILRRATPANIANLEDTARSRASILPAPQFTEVPGNDVSWSEPARALNLPERFVVTLYNQIKDPTKTGDPAQNGDQLFQELLMNRQEVKEGYPLNVTEMTAEFLEVVRTVEGVPLRQKPLPVGPHPRAGQPGGPPEELDDEKGLTGNLAWLADFEVAVEEGMAMVVPLYSEEEFKNGFKRLVVLGVRTSQEPDENARQLELLISNHAHTEGFELVPQGTPTNNTGTQGAGYSSADQYDAETSFAQWLQAPLFTEVNPEQRLDQADGQRLAQALGIDATTLQHVRHTGGQDGHEAMLLNRVLWPATFGYFLDTGLYPLFSANRNQELNPVEQTRRFFTDYVSGRGGVPAVRVGNEPYGILPTTQFSAWQVPRSLNEAVPGYGDRLWDVIRRLDVTWTERLSQFVAYPNRRYETPFNVAPPGQQDILTVLGQDASSVEAYQRYSVGPTVMDTLATEASKRSPVINIWAQIVNINPNGSSVNLGRRENNIGRFGTPDNPENLLYTEFLQLFDPAALNQASPFGLTETTWPWVYDLALQSNFRKVVHTFADEPRPQWNGAPGSMIDGLPFSETEPVQQFADRDFNFITWLAEADFNQIRLEDFHELYGGDLPGSFTVPNSLLYRLLRHAVLLQYWEAALMTYEDAGQPIPREEKELFNILSQDIARWDLLYRESPTTGSNPLYHELQNGEGRGGKMLVAYRQQLAELANTPTARLERALAEHLDLGTYRLDAWKTAQVEYRLAELRRERPTGSFLGSFGWLEDVVSQDRSKVVEGAFEDPDNLGYIHAPTINHAATAAVLRQGYKSRQFTTAENDPAANRMAVNLSSERVRRSLATLESIRTGQSLASVLGQHFERGLREAEDTMNDGRPVGALIPEIREAFPFADEKTTLGQAAITPPAGAEQAARQVVDGLALLQAAKRTNYYPVAAGLPPDDGSEDAFVAVVRQGVQGLADTLDALGDLTVGESIHQIVMGNVEQASAMLENVAKGRFPSAPEIVHTPRGGTSVTHRVLLHLPGEAPEKLALWGNSTSPRATAEPGLNRWLATLLEEPGNLLVDYRYYVDGEEWDGQLFLADAQLQPIDLLFLTEGDALRSGSALDVHLAHVVRAHHYTMGDDPDGTGTVTFDFPAATAQPLRRVLPLLHRVRQLLGAARAAVPGDLAGPSRQSPGQLDAGDEGLDLGIADRLSEVRTRLDELAEQLRQKQTEVAAGSPTTRAARLRELRDILHALAGYGLPEAGAATAPDVADPLGSAKAVEQAVQRRQQEADGVAVEETSAYFVRVAQALLGSSFRLAPPFRLNGTALDFYAQSMQPDHLTDLLREHGENTLITQEWLQGVARVREPMDHLEKVILINDLLRADATDFLPLPLIPTQLSAQPADPNRADYWLGVRYPADYEPAGDAVSLVQLLPVPAQEYDATLLQQAFLLDEWTEVIPPKEEVTSVAFHYDQPNTEAPQTLLLVVSPDSNEQGEWKWEALLGAVNETLDLAKKRAIEPDTLSYTHLGILLPALIAPVAQEATTITLDYRRVNNTAAFRDEALYSDFQ